MPDAVSLEDERSVTESDSVPQKIKFIIETGNLKLLYKDQYSYICMYKDQYSYNHIRRSIFIYMYVQRSIFI